MGVAAHGPLVSIVVPASGRRPLLAETLASVQAQTLTDWEAVVIDDASPDDTAAWLAATAAADGRIRPLSLAGPRAGANAARNAGLAAAAGRYVVFLDSDDLLEPDALAGRVAVLDARPDLDFCVHAMRCFRDRPGDTDLAWNTLTDEDDLDRYLLLDGPWQTAGATWRRSALPRVGPWDPGLLSLQDLDFHARALGAGLRHAKVDAWDGHYRLPYGRPSVTCGNHVRDHCRSHARIARRLLDVPPAVVDGTPRRRALLGGFCFRLADRCAQKGDLRGGLRLWAHARRRRVVSAGWYAQGVLLLAARKRPRLTDGLRTWVRRRWPADWRCDDRHTFLDAPLPPRAAGGQVPALPRAGMGGGAYALGHYDVAA